MQFLQVPSILNIHLDIFNNKRPTDYPTKINLQAMSTKYEYSLCGLVEFRRDDQHFVSYVKIQDGTWQECNDSVYVYFNKSSRSKSN